MDPTKRFSNRVENYSRYRPRYPKEVITALQEDCGLTPDSVVADIGSGTGFLAEMFLQNGNQVFAVEPNREMRDKGRSLMAQYPDFRSVNGKAEATTLSGGSVDFVIAGQSFHWFDRPKAHSEFCRILKPGGWAMVIWNEREFQSTPFLRAYDQILQRYAPDYARLAHKRVYDTTLDDFFGSNGFTTRTFNYRQDFDYDGVKGRMLSSSYTPEADHPNHAPMLAELSRIFRACEAGGRVSFEYTTRMYYGHII